jgi:hypothetical protein
MNTYYVGYNPSSRVPMGDYSNLFESEEGAKKKALQMANENGNDTYYVLRAIGKVGRRIAEYEEAL